MAAVYPEEEESVLKVGDFNVDKHQATLGSSQFSTVYHGRHAGNNQKVAFKVVDASRGSNEEREAARQKVRREALNHSHMIAAKINHPNLVAVLAVQSLVYVVRIVMELGTLGNLDEYFKSNVVLCSNSIGTLMQKIRLMRDAARGLAFLHSVNIAHRDLKPDNILVTTSGAKICDFGSIKVLTSKTEAPPGEEMTSDVGCRFFHAPELFKDVVRYGLKSDVFSLGLVFAAMIQALPGKTLLPVAEGSTINCLMTIGQEVLQNPDLVVLADRDDDQEMLAELKHLIRGMLQASPERQDVFL